MEKDFRAEIGALVQDRKQAYTAMSDRIWGFAEPRFQEYDSSRLQQEYLKARGFSIRADLAGEETAFIAEYGSGKPVLAFLGEFDALSSLEQEADSTERRPVPGKTNGHGCGHHLLGTAAVAAADALKTYMESHGLLGTIRYYGCPAEENAGGKAYLVRDGFFNDCDAAITWHPSTTNKTMMADKYLSNLFFTFHGISSHAAGAPELGRSALDAVEIMDIGVNYMREHMIDEARVHGAITNPGGIAPNVIPSEAQILYAIRAPKVTQVKKLYERMCDIARGAALITGTTVDIKQVAAYSNVIENDTLEDIMYENMRHFVPIGYTEEELAYARRFQEVITELDKEGLKDLISILSGRDKEKKRQMEESPMLDFVLERHVSFGGGGSTDVGDVSWVVPTGKVDINCYAAGTALHSWQAVAQGKAPAAHKGMLTAAKIMACTGAELLEKPELLERIKEDWLEKLDGETYPEPLPKDVKPEIW